MMSSIPDGSYHLYTPGTQKPILVQIENDWVYSLHFEYTYHVSKFEGRFVCLRELQTLDEEQEIIAAFVRQVYRRAEHNMATNGTVSGAHWNAIRQELAARGITEPTSNEPN